MRLCMRLGYVISSNALEVKTIFFFQNSCQTWKTGQKIWISARQFWRQFPVVEYYVSRRGKPSTWLPRQKLAEERITSAPPRFKIFDLTSSRHSETITWRSAKPCATARETLWTRCFGQRKAREAVESGFTHVWRRGKPSTWLPRQKLAEERELIPGHAASTAA